MRTIQRRRPWNQDSHQEPSDPTRSTTDEYYSQRGLSHALDHRSIDSRVSRRRPRRETSEHTDYYSDDGEFSESEEVDLRESQGDLAGRPRGASLRNALPSNPSAPAHRPPTATAYVPPTQRRAEPDVPSRNPPAFIVPPMPTANLYNQVPTYAQAIAQRPTIITTPRAVRNQSPRRIRRRSPSPSDLSLAIGTEAFNDANRIMAMHPLDVPVNKVPHYIAASPSHRNLRKRAAYQHHVALFAKQNKWEEYTGVDPRMPLHLWKAMFEETAGLLMLPQILWGTGARLQVRGPAKRKLIQEDPREEWSYNVMCEKLADEFDRISESALFAKCERISQMPNESVGSYAARMYEAHSNYFSRIGGQNTPLFHSFIATRLQTKALPELRRIIGKDLFSYRTYEDMKYALQQAEQVYKELEGIPPVRGRVMGRPMDAGGDSSGSTRPSTPTSSIAPGILPLSVRRPTPPRKTVTFNTPSINALDTEPPEEEELVFEDGSDDHHNSYVTWENLAELLNIQARPPTPKNETEPPMTRQEVQRLLEESRQAVNTEQSHKMSEAFDHFRRTNLTPGDHNAIAVMKRIQSGPSRHLDIVCYRCKEKGHYQRDCPLPNPYNRSTNYPSRVQILHQNQPSPTSRRKHHIRIPRY